MPGVSKLVLSVVLVALLASIIGSCAQTVSVSYMTEFRTRKQYTHVLFATGFTYTNRDAISTKVQKSLADRGVECTFFWEVFPPKDGYSPFPAEDEFSAEEFIMQIDADSIDAILVIFPCDISTWEYEWKNRPEKTDKRIDGFGGFHWIRKEGEIRGASTGQWENAVAELYDAGNGALVWDATLGSRGGALASASTLASSIAAKTISKMAKDGLIP